MKKDILFIDAAVKSREKNLIGAERLLRLSEAENVEELYKQLKEIGFGGESFLTSSDFSVALSYESKALNDFIKEYAPNEEIKFFFLSENDFFNAENAVKQKFLNLDSDIATLPFGEYTFDQLVGLVNGKIKLNGELSAVVNEAFELLEGKNAGGAELDALFINARYKAIKKRLKKPLLKKITETEINLKNMTTALRSGGKEAYDKLKIEGGSLNEKQLLALIEKNTEKIKAEFKNMAFSSFADLIIADLNAKTPLFNFEKSVDDYIVDELKKTRFLLRGIEPFILYCYYRKNEIKNVRLIATAIINGLDIDKIRSKLRSTYGDFSRA